MGFERVATEVENDQSDHATLYFNPNSHPVTRGVVRGSFDGPFMKPIKPETTLCLEP